MMELANIFALFQEGGQVVDTLPAEGSGFSQFFAAVWNYLKGFGLGPVEMSAITIALLLALLAIFAKVVRMIASTLFLICIVLLVLQLTGCMDTSAVWETVMGWLGVAESPQG